MKLIFIAHNLRSIYNIGSLFRTGDGLGVTKLFLTGYSPSPKTNPLQLAKTALGAQNSVPWESKKNLLPVLKNLKKDGWEIIALEEKEGVSEDYRSWRPKDKVAIVLGNEIAGINAKTLAICDKIIALPMQGTKNSLNVSVAAGAIGYYCLTFTKA